MNITVCFDLQWCICFGHAGLLNNTECGTTHWRRVKQLQAEFPKCKVINNRYSICQKSNNVYTSAGISAGIDLSLAILEDFKRKALRVKVARGLVIVTAIEEVVNIARKVSISIIAIISIP